MTYNKVKIFFIALMFLQACGTADEYSACKASSPSSYVAATSDPDGAPWTMTVNEQAGGAEASSGLALTCTVGTTPPLEMTGTFNVTIKDGRKIPKAGVAINATVSGVTNMVIDTATSDLNTNSCGVAQFAYKYTCPTFALSNTGSVTFFSGGLATQIPVTAEAVLPAAAATTTLTSPQ